MHEVTPVESQPHIDDFVLKTADHDIPLIRGSGAAIMFAGFIPSVITTTAAMGGNSGVLPLYCVDTGAFAGGMLGGIRQLDTANMLIGLRPIYEFAQHAPDAIADALTYAKVAEPEVRSLTTRLSVIQSRITVFKKHAYDTASIRSAWTRTFQGWYTLSERYWTIRPEMNEIQRDAALLHDVFHSVTEPDERAGVIAALAGMLKRDPRFPSLDGMPLSVRERTVFNSIDSGSLNPRLVTAFELGRLADLLFIRFTEDDNH